MPADSVLPRPGAALRYADVGAGPDVLFQHGLGGDAAQVAEVFPDGAWRRLTLECRGQGGSEVGPPESLSIAAFADDVLALADARGVARATVGGISMGAAIALRLAARHTARVRALILVRPAWLFADGPETMRGFIEIAGLLQSLPPAEARARFAAGPLALRLAREAPDNLASMLGFFDRPNPGAVATLLSRIAADGPGVSREEAAGLRLPTLLIGCARDHVHPLAFVHALADAIPGARLVEVTPKADDRARHAAEVRAAIAGFLAEHGTAP